jgi:branched-chain amino acid transport system substrate-binding protein
MTKIRPWFWLTTVLVIALVAGFACGDDDDDDDDGGEPSATAADGGSSGEVKTDVGVTDTEIKLGQHIVQSGNLAAVYQPVAPTIKAYLDYVNGQGGVCDREITLLVEDDQYAPAVALEKAKKLAEQDKVAAFIGNLGTPPNTGSAQYINQQEIPDLFLATGVNAFADSSTLPWTTLFNPDYKSEGKILADYLNENFPDQTVAILYQNDDFGKSGRDSFKEAFAGQVVAEETYESTATDINSQMANLRNASPAADILYMYSTPAYTARAYGYMLQNSWTPQVVMSYVNSATTLAGLVGGDAGAAEGFKRIAGAIGNNYVLDAVADANDPALVEHTQIMADNGGPPVGTLTVYAQAIAETAVHTLEIACENGDLTRQGIMDAAESIDGFHPSTLLEGIDITLSSDDHSAIQALTPIEIQADGTLKPLVDAPIEAATE